jgi:hypothetical protein
MPEHRPFGARNHKLISVQVYFSHRLLTVVILSEVERPRHRLPDPCRLRVSHTHSNSTKRMPANELEAYYLRTNPEPGWFGPPNQHVYFCHRELTFVILSGAAFFACEESDGVEGPRCRSRRQSAAGNSPRILKLKPSSLIVIPRSAEESALCLN